MIFNVGQQRTSPLLSTYMNSKWKKIIGNLFEGRRSRALEAGSSTTSATRNIYRRLGGNRHAAANRISKHPPSQSPSRQASAQPVEEPQDPSQVTDAHPEVPEIAESTKAPL